MANHLKTMPLLSGCAMSILMIRGLSLYSTIFAVKAISGQRSPFTWLPRVPTAMYTPGKNTFKWLLTGNLKT